MMAVATSHHYVPFCKDVWNYYVVFSFSRFSGTRAGIFKRVWGPGIDSEE
jgi:hypothetical protein